MSKQAFTALLFFVMLLHTPFAQAGPGTPPIPNPIIPYDRIMGDPTVGELNPNNLLKSFREPPIAPTDPKSLAELKKPIDFQKHTVSRELRMACQDLRRKFPGIQLPHWMCPGP